MEKNSPIHHETEPTAEIPLDKQQILEALDAYMRDEGLELDVDLGNPQDVLQLIGEDDNEFLGNLASLAASNGLDHEELFERLGIPLDQTAVDPSEETE